MYLYLIGGEVRFAPQYHHFIAGVQFVCAIAGSNGGMTLVQLHRQTHTHTQTDEVFNVDQKSRCNELHPDTRAYLDVSRAQHTLHTRAALCVRRVCLCGRRQFLYGTAVAVGTHHGIRGTNMLLDSLDSLQ